MNKQTAVDLLANEIKEARRLCDDSTIEMDIWHTLDVLIKKSEQAKQMEKEQHEETWFSSRVEDMGDEFKVEQKSFEDYYNETYGETKN